MYIELLPIKILLEEQHKNVSDKNERSKLSKVLQEELNTTLIPTFSFEAYKKTTEEKMALKTMKKLYKNK
tara:strand:+ start:1385 stop:1594 length:210 start_codon:yes stop_codon:yes gene_type:complete